ncbi:MAG: histidine--tRNA ligase [Acholeplasmataceae bacterium]|jgi:histidyl-tRNA synthetase
MNYKVKGTYDLLPEDSIKWQYVETKLKEIFAKYNYKEIRTPIMEYSEVFHREGEFSDMVQKETYNFLDKGNRRITLRPEATAGIMRSVIENKSYAQNDVLKYFYIGPNYRYERPQKGRFREFYQFGVEAIGLKSPFLDGEVIMLASDIINEFGLKGVLIKLNSLGDNESRKKYQEALKTYFENKKDLLCQDCQTRLEVNPLRILDCKIDGPKEVVQKAPHSINFLTEESKKHLMTVLKVLDQNNINYEVDTHLVRGIDYYSEIVFEIHAQIADFGNANTLGGGGGYDNLSNDLGGPKLSGIGFSFGMERFVEALEVSGVMPELNYNLDAYIITFDEDFNQYAAKVLKKLRDHNFVAEMDYDTKSMKSKMKKALKLDPKYLVFIGEDEINHNLLTVKDTLTQDQNTIQLDEFLQLLGGK